MERDFKGIMLLIKDMETGEFVHYDLKNLQDYKNNITTFKAEFGSCDDNIYMEIIENEYNGVLQERNLEEFLILCDEFKEVQPQYIIDILQNYSILEVRELLYNNI